MKNNKKIDLKNIKSILFFRLGKLGDMMLASFVFKKVKEKYPNIKMHLITLPRSKDLFKYNRDIDFLDVWQPLSLPYLFFKKKFYNIDLFIDLNDLPSRRSILGAKLFSQKKSIGFHNELSKKYFNYTVKIPSNNKSHLLERLNKLLEFLNIKVLKKDLKPVVYVNKSNLEKIKKQKNNIVKKGKLISINISAGHESRYWKDEKWIKLINFIIKKNNNVFFRLLYLKKDKNIVEKIKNNVKTKNILPDINSDIDSFLCAIKVSDLLISPDTSAIHAAFAFDVPQICLFPEPYWNYISFRPLNKNSYVIKSSKNGVDNIDFEEVKNYIYKRKII